MSKYDLPDGIRVEDCGALEFSLREQREIGRDWDATHSELDFIIPSVPPVSYVLGHN